MSNNEHILIVDDNVEVRDILVQIIQEYGYHVSWAADGKSMRDFLQDDDTVTAIILDATLPDERSESLFLHTQELGLPVVMISGNPAAIKFAEEGHLQLLKKPFRSQELVDALTKAISSGKPGQRTE